MSRLNKVYKVQQQLLRFFCNLSDGNIWTGLGTPGGVGYGNYFVMEYGLPCDYGTISDCSGRPEQRNKFSFEFNNLCMIYFECFFLIISSI